MRGAVCDAMLAACPDLKNLQRLNLTGNCLTSAGIAALQAHVPSLVAISQWTPLGNDDNDRQYLYRGDIE